MQKNREKKRKPKTLFNGISMGPRTQNKYSSSCKQIINIKQALMIINRKTNQVFKSIKHLLEQEQLKKNPDRKRGKDTNQSLTRR